MFQTFSGIDITIEIDPDKVRAREVAEIYGDPGKLQAQTGWHRQISLQKTVEDMLNCWRSQCRSQDAIATV
jgi:GDP-D-mannose dehydratase